jgi:GntR family transcriptional regulator/MocR family aminotransferase
MVNVTLPTSSRVLPPIPRLELLRWASRSDVRIVEDDYDASFAQRSAIELFQGLIDRTCGLHGTFSKALFPSLRLGYLIVPESLSPQLPRSSSDQRHAPTFAGGLGEFISSNIWRHMRRALTATRRRATMLEAIRQSLGDRVTVVGECRHVARFTARC